MTLDQAGFVLTYIVPILMLVIKVGIMWSAWSLLCALTKLVRTMNRRLGGRP